jgi:hypothetical protein
VPRRHCHAGFDRQIVNFPEIEAIGLTAAAADAKALPADARQAEQAVRQLVEIDDCRQRADIEGLGGSDLAALANQHHAERLALAHAAPHHVDVAGFKYPQRQRTIREQHDIQRK